MNIIKEYFSLTAYGAYAKHFFNLTFGPDKLEDISASQWRIRSLHWWSSSLGFFILLQLVFSLSQLEYLHQYSQILSGMVAAKRLSYWYFWMNAFPYSILFSAFFSLFLLTWESFWSFVLVKIFRNKHPFLDILGVAAYANVYLNLSFSCVFVMYRIAPEWIQTDTFGMAAFIGLNLLFIAIGFILHIYSFLKIGQQALQISKWSLGAMIATPNVLLVLLFLWGK